MKELTDIVQRLNDDLMDFHDDLVDLSDAEMRSKGKLNESSFTGWLLSSGCGILLGWFIYGIVLNSTYPIFVSDMPFVYQLLNIIFLSIPISLAVGIGYILYDSRER